MEKCKVSMWLVGIGLLLSVGVAATRAGQEEGLVSYYKLDDGSGTVATDASGNGHDGTLIQPELVWLPGYDGSALGFPGLDTAARLEIPTTGMSATAGTISVWGYLSATQPTWIRYFFGHTTQPQFGNRIQLYMEGGNLLDVSLGTRGTAIDTVELPVEQWHHIAVTWDSGAYVVYVDGKEVKNGTYTGLTALNAIANIGNDGSSAPYESFGGRLDEARIYNRAVTAAEVTEMFQAPHATVIKAWAPSPANGDMSVTVGTLEWKSLDTIPSHNVYMGTDPNLTAADLIGPAVPVCMFFYLPGLQPGTTYYWRVDEIESDGVTVHRGDVWTFTAQDLTAYGPDPADGAIDASPAPTLTWQAGQDAVKHHVYFGTNQEAVAKGDKTTDRATVDQPLFKPGELQEAKTYYWRVDEILVSGAVRTGPVWSFRTYVRVDDFETYTDDEGSRIFETWIDGVTNGTGAQVGYWKAPFAEQKIVHGGTQSMPFEYNNVKPPYYSEAEQEFPSAEGGGSYDIDTLVLWVRGQATNSPATLYVGLKDIHGQVGIVTNPDPTIVTTSKWTEWQVFMPQFMATGVDLMAVKKIMIGVGDRQNPAQGGTGLIFLDDIHAIKTMTFDPSQMMMMP